MLTYGFFNSSNGDRKYTAEQMSDIFDQLLTEGVLETYGNKYFTIPQTSGLGVIVRTGWAWFDQTWTKLDADQPFQIDVPDLSLSRIDTVAIVTNKSELTRANSIQILKGTPSVVPTPVVMEDTATVHTHPIAYVTIRPEATQITAADIEILVGKAACPFITSILQATDITTLFANWEQQFDTWFENIQEVLSEDVITNLQLQIDQRVKISDKATTAEAQAGTNDTKWMTPAKVRDAVTEVVSNVLDLGNPTFNILRYVRKDTLIGYTPNNAFATNKKYAFCCFDDAVAAFHGNKLVYYKTLKSINPNIYKPYTIFCANPYSDKAVCIVFLQIGTSSTYYTCSYVVNLEKNTSLLLTDQGQPLPRMQNLTYSYDGTYLYYLQPQTGNRSSCIIHKVMLDTLSDTTYTISVPSSGPSDNISFSDIDSSGGILLVGSVYASNKYTNTIYYINPMTNTNITLRTNTYESNSKSVTFSAYKPEEGAIYCFIAGYEFYKYIISTKQLSVTSAKSSTFSANTIWKMSDSNSLLLSYEKGSHILNISATFSSGNLVYTTLSDVYTYSKMPSCVIGFAYGIGNSGTIKRFSDSAIINTGCLPTNISHNNISILVENRYAYLTENNDFFVCDILEKSILGVF